MFPLRGLQVATFFVLPLFSTCAVACSCGPLPPPCEAIGWSELVFLGTVTEMRAESPHFKRARMRADRAYKGELEEAVELYDNGMCEGPRLEIGRQYLIYTSGLPSTALPARGCTRSRPVEGAQEDLQFLEKRSAGKTTTHVSGTVRYRAHEPDDSDLGDDDGSPLTNVIVSLTTEGRTLQTTTDVSGVYSFPAVSPGEYEIMADLPGYRLDWAPWDITVHANVALRRICS